MINPIATTKTKTVSIIFTWGRFCPSYRSTVWKRSSFLQPSVSHASKKLLMFSMFLKVPLDELLIRFTALGLMTLMILQRMTPSFKCFMTSPCPLNCFGVENITKIHLTERGEEGTDLKFQRPTANCKLYERIERKLALKIMTLSGAVILNWQLYYMQCFICVLLISLSATKH